METYRMKGIYGEGDVYVLKTKGGSLIKVTNADKDNMTVAGGWQLEHNMPMPVNTIYDPNPYDAKSMPFINELKKLCKATSPYEIGRSEIASSVRSICFSTYKCEGEKDFTNFAFTDGCTFKELQKMMDKRSQNKQKLSDITKDIAKIIKNQE